MVAVKGDLMKTTSTYYFVDAEGFLASTLELTDQETAGRADLQQNKPKERTDMGGVRSALMTLEECKAIQWRKVKQARDQAESAGFSWDGSTFDSDPSSQARINGAVTLAMLNPAMMIDWTLADNTKRTLNAADLFAVGIALGAHVNEQHQKARELRDQIAGAQVMEEVTSRVHQLMT